MISYFGAPHSDLLRFLSGWHTHLDFLAEALDNQAVGWPHWPIDRWARHYERYSRKLIEKQKEELSSRKGNL